jgi:hypothetical protein
MNPATATTGVSSDFEFLLIAISSSIRWRILRELAQEPLPSGVIAERTGEEQYNITKHMRVLCKSGIVIRGYGNVYRIRPEIRVEGGSTLDLGVATIRLDRQPTD